MRNRDQEDMQGILQALQRSGNAQLNSAMNQAPAQMQAPSPDMRELNAMLMSMNGGGQQAPQMQAQQQPMTAQNPHADLLAFANQYMGGGKPDLNQLIQTFEKSRQPVQEDPKGILGALAELASGAAAYKAKNPRAGIASLLFHGSSAAYENRKTKDKTEKERQLANKERLVGDVLGLARDQRLYDLDITKDQKKYDLDLKKLAADSIQDKFNPVTGELVRFQNGQATGAGGAGVGGYNSGSYATSGIPQANKSTNPYANTPKGQMMHAEKDAELQNKRVLEQDKKLSEISKKAEESSAQLSAVDTLEGLMQKFTSGPIAGGVYHEHIGSYFGDKNTAAAKTFQKLATQAFTLATSQSMKGAQSDKDMNLITGSQIGLDSDPRTNQNLLNVYRAESQRYNQYADFAKKWTGNGGDLEEFNRRWRKYANATPLISQGEDGQLVINKDNLANADIIFNPDFENIIAAYEPITQTKKQSEETGTSAPKQRENPYDQMSLQEKKQLLQQLEK